MREVDRLGDAVARPEEARGDELTLLEDSRGTLWAGGWVSGITLFSPQGEASRFTVRDGLPGNSFPQLVEDSQGDVWAACNGGGLVRFRPRAARRYGVDPAGYPFIARIEAACQALPAFQAALPERQPDAV